MTLLTVLTIVAAALTIPATVNLFRRADLRRMALRNVARRPVETALIIVGSALGTAIIAAALMVGDTFDASIRDIARRDLGEIDLIATFDDETDLNEAVSRLDSSAPEGVDGHLAVGQLTVAMAAGDPDDPDRPVEPRVVLGVVDFDQAARFGSAPERYGLAGIELGSDGLHDGVVINEAFADDLGVEVADTVMVLASGQEFPMTVTDVVTEEGLGGFSDAWVSQPRFDALGVPSAAVRRALAVSLDGTVFDTVDASPEMRDRIDELMNEGNEPLDADFFEAKRDLIEEAEAEGTELTTIFSVVGGFSVMAGVLLLINLFVMLSEERKPNLGVLRAIGWKRRTLRQAFRAEGVIYSVPAAIVGALLGVVVGWIIIGLTRGILQSSYPNSSFVLQTTVEWSSLLVAGLVGLIIAMGAIAFTSWRISRLNIVAAIRDLTEPPTRRSRLLRSGAGVLAVVVGAVTLVVGLGGPQPYVAIVSVPLIVVGLALLVREVMPPMIITALGGIIVLLWAVLFFEIMPEETTIEIEFFLLYGAVMVGAGVGLATVSGSLLQRLVNRLASAGVPSRLAMAYPTARTLRTASSLAMYSLIVFSLAFMAVMANGIDQQSSDLVVASSAGHDVLVDSNLSNPLDPADVVDELDDVTSASAVTWTGTEFSAPYNPDSIEEPIWWSVNSADSSFTVAGVPVLEERASRFASDEEVFEWIQAGGQGLLVPIWFLTEDPDDPEPSIGDWVTAEILDGETVDLEVVGIVDADFTSSGVWIGRETLEQIDDEAVATRVYVATEEGADPARVASRIEARFLDSGARAESFEDRIRRFVEVDLGFFSLLRGYLLLGLVIGIGGLAVTLFRAVRERRRQIGMLRSMGLAGRGVGRWFLGEATFISVMGIVVGVGLGVLSAYFVATRSTAIDDNPLPFAIPWLPLAAIIAIPFVASTLAALLPARRAANLRPSEALRLAD